MLLKNRIGADQLPLRYGGTRPDVTEHKVLPRQKDPSIDEAVQTVKNTPPPKQILDTSASSLSSLDTQEAKGEDKSGVESPVAEEGVVAEVPPEVKKGGFKTAPSSCARSEIAPKGTLEVELGVDMEEGSRVAVSWGFKLHTFLATMDIGFSVTFKPKAPAIKLKGKGKPANTKKKLKEKPKIEVIRPFSRVPENSPDASGTWSTNRPGTLTFCWDNRYKATRML